MKAEKDKRLEIILQSFESLGVLGAIVIDPRANKDNKHNVRYRLTYNRERKFLNAGYAYTLIDWERINSKMVKDETLKNEKNAIVKKLDEIKTTITEIGTDGKAFTFDLLFRKLGKGDKNNLFLAFDVKITKLLNEGRVGSAITYTNTVGSLWTFHNKYEGKEPFSKLYASSNWLKTPYRTLTFENITIDYINEYKAWLKTPYRTTANHKEKVRSDATLGIYLRSLRAVLNENDVPASKYPFGKDKATIPTGTSRKIALNKDVIGLIAAHPLKDNAAMYRDLWLFSYLCNGANLKDILRLKNRNVEKEYIYFKRAKTEHNEKSEVIQVNIHPEMKRIINDWGNDSKVSESFVFPFLQFGLSPLNEKKIISDYTKRIDLCMKRIAKELNIDANITLYSARHSFAVNSERKGVRTSLISKALGHKNIATTKDYLGSFDNSELVELSQNLL